jgi:ATP10 protein
MKLYFYASVGILLLGGILIGFAELTNAQKEPMSNSNTEPKFPNVKGENLLKRKLNLPQEFGGELNVVIIAFDRNQQSMIDEWLPETKKLAAKFPKLGYYEIPTIRKLPGFIKSFINNGMRRGIPSQDSRETTITLYLDKKKFLGSLGIVNEKTIHILLVNRQGKIFGKWEDKYTPEKFAGIEKKVSEAFPNLTEKQ